MKTLFASRLEERIETGKNNLNQISRCGLGAEDGNASLHVLGVSCGKFTAFVAVVQFIVTLLV